MANYRKFEVSLINLRLKFPHFNEIPNVLLSLPFSFRSVIPSANGAGVDTVFDNKWQHNASTSSPHIHTASLTWVLCIPVKQSSIIIPR
jgi:hypothetical protein